LDYESYLSALLSAAGENETAERLRQPVVEQAAQILGAYHPKTAQYRETALITDSRSDDHLSGLAERVGRPAQLCRSFVLQS
jgi:hypothetical protein